MKTIEGKFITKKHIQEVLRTMDSTKVYALVHTLYGGRVEPMRVYQFIREFSVNKKVYKCAYEVAFNPKHQIERMRYNKKDFDYRVQNRLHIAMQIMRKELGRKPDRYSKRPLMGHTHLYFCSPEYGHSDYNKWRALPISGNERFCELICRLADKHF